MSQKIFKKIGDTLWLHFQGQTYTVSLKRQMGAGRTAKTSDHRLDGVLVSPMPGKILKTNFKEGEGIQAGQTVVVIEAMKMEYALKAPFKGKVKSVLKKAGDRVDLEERVAEIEPEVATKEAQ